MTGRDTGTAFDAPTEIADRLAVARRPLLLATDVDGTLAPIVARPEQARLAPGALGALVAVASLPSVELAVVSGRSLDQLRHQFGLRDEWYLIGSYGAESGHAAPLDDDELGRRDEVVASLRQIAGSVRGAMVELKPVGAALHVRGATPADAATALAAARSVFGDDPTVTVHEGHAVYEVAVRRVTKAAAFAELRAALRPATVAFIGDDRSDEGVFAELGEDDIGVKVGTGATAAEWRVADPVDVVTILRLLAASS